MKQKIDHYIWWMNIMEKKKEMKIKVCNFTVVYRILFKSSSQRTTQFLTIGI